MALHRWRFVDPHDDDPTTNTYTFEINPREMTSPFVGRSIVAQGSTAVGGQVLVWEGNAGGADWSFSGRIRTSAMYQALLAWSKRPNRIYVYDHFGRRLTVVLTKFDPVPKTTRTRYWNHDYTVNALVLAITSPTVGEIWN